MQMVWCGVCFGVFWCVVCFLVLYWGLSMLMSDIPRSVSQSVTSNRSLTSAELLHELRKLRHPMLVLKYLGTYLGRYMHI